MRPDRLLRLIVLSGTLVVLVVLSALQHPHEGSQDASRALDLTSATADPPTNAAKVFRWGSAQWHDEFVEPLAPMWYTNSPRTVRNQHGMLTIESNGSTGSVGARVVGHNRRYGRWEARVRGRDLATSGTPYRVVWELIPMYGGYHCGARDIVLSDYRLGSDVTQMHIRNLPDHDFTATASLPLSNEEFHTYAVEVTPDHVSWFYDTHVIRTERRPEALSAAVYAVRFRLVGTPGATMRHGWMQMDWVRYYTLDRPNALSIEAPATTLTTYDAAC